MENWTIEEIQKQNEFLTACDEMIAGKFILSDTKVAKILKCIATNQHLYHLFEKCLIGFDFQAQLEKSAKQPFQMPETTEEILAFVFCFLLEVDNKHISLQNFVNQYFYSKEGYNSSYHNFALTMLSPFKEGVVSMLEDVEQEQEVETITQVQPQPYIVEDQDEEIYDILKAQLSNLMIHIRQSRKIKDNKMQSMRMVVDAMMEALDLQNWRIINGLLISMDILLEKEKSANEMYALIKQTVFNYYYNR